MWISTINKIFEDLEIEVKGDTVIINSPLELDNSSIKIIKELIPKKYYVAFKVDHKQDTPDIIEQFLRSTQMPGYPVTINIVISPIHRSIVVAMNGDKIKPLNSSNIKALQIILERDKYFKSYQIYVNGIEVKFSIEVENSTRQKIIQKDDITNLIILLNDPSITLDEFLEVC
jgi:hypothetical protein